MKLTRGILPRPRLQRHRMPAVLLYTFSCSSCAQSQSLYLKQRRVWKMTRSLQETTCATYILQSRIRLNHASAASFQRPSVRAIRHVKYGWHGIWLQFPPSVRPVVLELTALKMHLQYDNALTLIRRLTERQMRSSPYGSDENSRIWSRCARVTNTKYGCTHVDKCFATRTT